MAGSLLLTNLRRTAKLWFTPVSSPIQSGVSLDMEQSIITRYIVMTTSEAVRLQKRWNISKYPIKCQHKVQLLERSDVGHLTGNYVCTTCGAVVMGTIYLPESRVAK